MLQSVSEAVRLVYEDIPGIKGHYLYRPGARKPVIIINQHLPEVEQEEIIIALFQESLLKLAIPGAALFPLEISYPMGLPTPSYRRWFENGKLSKLMPGETALARVIG